MTQTAAFADLDMVVKIPEDGSEPGDPLSDLVKEVITHFAPLGWWPLTFGLNDGETVELMFSYSPDPETVKRQVEHFILTEGN